LKRWKSTGTALRIPLDRIAIFWHFIEEPLTVAWAASVESNTGPLCLSIMQAKTLQSDRWKNNHPVSIIIPCYNAERWIGEAIQSCLDQTYRPIEIIVVDDGSTDKSKEAVSHLAATANVPIRLISTENNGASAARNRGLLVATGDYLQFLDADDLLAPRKIELQVVAAVDQPRVVPCGPWLWLRQSNGILTTEKQAYPIIGVCDPVREWLEGERYFVIHCFLWPRAVLADLGGWDESLAAHQDTDLYIRAVLKGVGFRFVPDSTVFYRTGHTNSSVSSRRTPDAVKSRIRVLEKLQIAFQGRGDLHRYGAALTRRFYEDCRWLSNPAEARRCVERFLQYFPDPGDRRKYRTAIARSYYEHARSVALNNPVEARMYFERFVQHSPDVRVPGTFANHMGTRLLGVVMKERLSRSLHRLLDKLR
jgi:glycosyltransferase involved in cell wall biosynthesis